ncbi:MAG TPA: right-handed parallel beta-helix repeat-containing protein [Bryobacteraceae bacterium]|nr:right-handed parallel beta-helix repeat-containing protein [Bryobacteraceae bacterium]
MPKSGIPRLFLCSIPWCVVMAHPQSIQSAVKAFPEAEGFGAVAIGGRGGQVIEVTNLNDSGPGSLRACVEASGPRTCVFRIGGNIVLKSKLAVRSPYITIAGQTAPGGGITLRTDPVNSSGLVEIRDTAYDVVIRNIRIRPGPGSGAGNDLDAVTIMGSRVILDHVSASWGVDENVNSWYSTAHDITVQWSIVSEGLNNSTHTEGPHSKGMLLGSQDAHSITAHHNLFAHNDERHPQVKTRTGGVVDVVNNVVYNWGQKAAYTDDSYGIPPVNFVGNYYKPGANSSLGMYEIHHRNAAGRGTELFVKGNIGPHRLDDSLPESEVVRPEDRGYIVATRHAAPLVTTQTAQVAFELVLAGAGASIALRCDGTGYLRRDTVDTRIVTDVRNGTGRIIDDPSQVGGWPVLEPGAGCVDVDRDGMPDVWESAHGFNPGLASDGAQDADGDGYTNLEEYLNITDPRGGSPPPPSDTTPPVISGVAADGVTSSSADIVWATDEAADGQVEYCMTSTKCGTTTTLEGTLATQHRLHLFNLQAATTYLYWVKSTDASGNLAEAGPMAFVTPSAPSPGSALRVPQDFATIQSAIDTAKDGDVVLVSPGAYRENLVLAGKSVTLASEFYTTQDVRLIDQTILDGGGATVVTVAASAGAETKVIGFTIQNGGDGISAAGKLHILNNRIIGNSDGIDYEGGGGICRNNVFENNSDDGIDFDGPTEATVEDNLIRNNGDDGIEIRLHEYSGPTLEIIVRNNVISGNGEDGIQLIDHPGVSNRVFVIERNLIERNAMAGLGMMDNGVTVEDFRAASVTDPVHLFNNTFRNNPYAVTGGDNLVALNNIFLGSAGIGVKGVDGESIAAYNLFWGNGTDASSSNVDSASTVFADPLLAVDSRLRSGSPAIDAGTAFYQWKGQTVLNLPSNTYSGAAPDLGKFEYIGGGPTPAPLSVTSIMPASMRVGTSVNITISGTGFEPGLQVSLAGGQGSTPTVSRVTVVSSTTVTATVSVGTAGPKRTRYWDVVVVNPGGEKATLPRGFTVVK